MICQFNGVQEKFSYSKPPPFFETKFFGDVIQNCTFHLQIHFPEVQINWTIIPNAILDRDIFIETSDYFYHPPSIERIFEGITRPRFPSPKQNSTIEFGFIAFHEHSDLYYHTAIELGPLVLAIPEYIRSKMTIFVDRNGNPKWYDDYWESLGISPSQIKKFKQKSYYVKNLIITTPPIHAGYYPQPVQEMKKRVLKHFKINDTEPDLFVFAKRFTTRKVKNHYALEAALKNRFPSIEFRIHPADTFQNQVSFWRRVKIAIGPAGNAMTNILWMQNNTAVIEFNRMFCESAYLGLARDSGVRTYTMQFADQVGYDGRMTADIPLVLEAVELAIKEMGLKI